MQLTCQSERRIQARRRRTLNQPPYTTDVSAVYVYVRNNSVMHIALIYQNNRKIALKHTKRYERNNPSKVSFLQCRSLSNTNSHTVEHSKRRHFCAQRCEADDDTTTTTPSQHLLSRIFAMWGGAPVSDCCDDDALRINCALAKHTHVEM